MVRRPSRSPGASKLRLARANGLLITTVDYLADGIPAHAYPHDPERHVSTAVTLAAIHTFTTPLRGPLNNPPS